MFRKECRFDPDHRHQNSPSRSLLLLDSPYPPCWEALSSPGKARSRTAETPGNVSDGNFEQTSGERLAKVLRLDGTTQAERIEGAHARVKVQKTKRADTPVREATREAVADIKIPLDLPPCRSESSRPTILERCNAQTS